MSCCREKVVVTLLTNNVVGPQFASGGGIFDSSPKDAPGATFRESIELGAFKGGSAESNAATSGQFVT